MGDLQEIRWVLKDPTGIELPPPAKKTIDLEGRIVKDGVRKVVKDRQQALVDLVHAIKQYWKLSEAPLRLRGADHANAVLELNSMIKRVDGLLK